MDDILDSLNPPQKEAVLSTEGPVLIFAGAGAGKTKCLAHRLAYLVEQKKASLDQILGITFTNKSAQELSRRILQLLKLAKEGETPGAFATRQYLPWVGTFHSISVRLLRLHGEKIGLDRDFTIYDADDSLNIVKEAMKQLELDPKQFNPRGIRSIISNSKNELMTAEQFKPFAQGPFQQAAAEVYLRYQKRLKEIGALDFDDLIFRTVQLLKGEKDVRDWCHNQFRYILVDEYQDTNEAQYRLTSLLTNPKAQNICVVGDDHQAIYGWRGANYRNILNFERDFPGAKVFKLEQNYRSTQNILAAASQVIERVRHRSNKQLWTENEAGVPITLYEAPNAFQEADFLVTELQSLHMMKHRWNDFAVLYRTNAQSRQIEETLLAANIPYRLVGAVRFYERKEIKDMLAYLRLLANPRDVISLTRAINTPPRGIGPATLTKGGPKVEKFNAMMASLRESDTVLPAELISAVADKINLRDFLLDGTVEGEGRWENIEELINVAGEFPTLNDFLEHVGLVSEVDNFDANADAVTLMTLHASKGLEFTVVFMVGMEEGLFPHMRALESAGGFANTSGPSEGSEMDEERRLCYVGMTRAKKRLYLTYARQRMMHGGVLGALPSRFLREIDEKLLDRV